MPNIAVVGSISMDLVAVSKKRPKAGETVIGEAFHTIPGGKGANQAVAAARLGANVAMVGAVGNDDYGTVVRKNLENERIFIDYVVPVTDRTTGIAHIVLAEEDNSIVVVQGANALVNKSVVDRSKDLLVKADMVVLQLEIPLETVKYVLAICEEHNIPVMLNPAPAQVLSEEILEKVKAIIVEQLGVADTAVTMEASFIDDLGADSLDIVELVMAIEEEFDIEIPDSDAEKVVTVGDVVDYIKENVQ